MRQEVLSVNLSAFLAWLMEQPNGTATNLAFISFRPLGVTWATARAAFRRNLATLEKPEENDDITITALGRERFISQHGDDPKTYLLRHRGAL